MAIIIWHFWILCIYFITIVTALIDVQAPLILAMPTDRFPLSSDNILPIFNPNSLHHIQLDYSDEDLAARSNELLQYLSTSSAPLATIRRFSITGVIYDKREDQPNWIQIVNLLPRISLSELRWTIETPIPYEIIRILEQISPPCRLYYATSYSSGRHERMWEEVFGTGSKQPRGLENLVGSPILYSLKIDIRYGRFHNLESMDLVFRILSKTPALRALDLSLGHSGCVVGSGQPYAFDFASYPNVTFAPLESLSLKGYRLDEFADGGEAWRFRDPWDSNDRIEWCKSWERIVPTPIVAGMMEVKMSWRYLARDFESWWNKPTKKDEWTSLDCWLEVMDWSKLRTLNLDRPSNATLRKLRGKTLPGLRNLTITGGYEPSIDVLLDFVENTTSPLVSLSLRNICLCSTDGVLLRALSKHSQSLTRLSIHSPRSWCVPEDQTHIMRFAASCLLLSWLEIDMPYPPNSGTIGEYIATTYADLVSGTHSLREIVLHFPLPYINHPPQRKRGMSDLEWRILQLEYESMDLKDGEADLEIDREFVEKLFEYLMGKGGIEKLEIFVGDWGSRYQNIYRTSEYRGEFKRCVCAVGKGCVVDEEGGVGWEIGD